MKNIDQAIDELMGGGGASSQAPQGFAQAPAQQGMSQATFQGNQTSAPSSIDSAIDEIMASTSTQNRLSPMEIVKNTAMKANFGSPLSISESVNFSFATDDVSKETYLRSKFQFVEKLPNGKFAAGNSRESIAPVDPEGIFNDVLGKLARISSLIPSIAGQIIGGTLGIPGGPAGIIAGGTIGSGVGEAVSKGIGKGLGVNQQDAEAIATDIAIATSFGAAGEVIGAGLKLSKPLLLRKIGKIIDSGNTAKMNNPEAIKAHQSALAKVFKVIGEVDEEATRDVFKHGALNTFTKENLDEKTILRIADDFVNTVEAKRRQLGQKVGTVKGELISKTNDRAVLGTKDIAERMIADLKEAGVVTPQGFFKPSKDIIGFTGTEISTFKKVLNKLGVANIDSKNEVMEILGKNIKVSEALQLKSAVQGSAIAFGKRAGQGTANPVSEVILNRTLTGNLDNPIEGGIVNKLTDIAERVGAKNFSAANKEFAEFARLTKSLEKQGLKLDRLDAVENFAKRFEKKTQFLSDQFEQLNRKLPRNFIADIEKFNAAQAYKGTNINLLRFGAVAATVGSLTGFDTPKDKTFTIGGALLLGTPTGLRFLLKSSAQSSEAMKQGLKQIPKFRGKVLDERKVLAIISQLSRESTNKETDTQQKPR
jgi:outer membrane lipoprotein SlyB